MAKVYRSNVPDPQYTYGEGYNDEVEAKVESDYLTAVRTDLKKLGFNDPLTGEVVYYPWADGHAQYMIASTKPAVLIHLPLGDAWALPEAYTRGLRGKDLREKVQQQKNIKALFASKQVNP